MTSNSIIKLTKIWQDSSISKNTKLRLISDSCIWDVDRKAANKTFIGAFEMWAYRKMLRMSSIEHRTNASILEKLKINTGLSTEIVRQHLSYNEKSGGYENNYSFKKGWGKKTKRSLPFKMVAANETCYWNGLPWICSYC